MADTVLYVDMWVGDRIQGMKLAGIRGREFSALVSARRETGIGDCTIVTWDEGLRHEGENGYFAKFVPGYVEYWPHYREVRVGLLAEQEKVYALARPRLRRYRIVRKPR